MGKSLRELLGELHAERERTWDAGQLQLNIDQRRELVEAADPSSWIAAGDPLPDFALEEVDGGHLTLESLTATGPAVLLFFRFAGCPACNIALPYYDRELAPGLRELGATLVAVSPQVPERLVEIKRRHDLSFPVATDRDNVLGGKLGILYTANAATQLAGRLKGSFIGDTTGTGTWDLPQPTVVVVGQDRRAAFVDVSPDWLVRAEARPVLEAVRALAPVAAK
ncbi:MAG: AhpC/TSA family protein [Phenylobacterium sp.]|uniref:peroxiredoxin-like family protein n=1 Tax=Phenylobacterium sp. TaxID=1871053 RepID=UPI00121782DC|nr:peroxiredoxin-like family protein [Phenylobacterium sp.]TAJ71985.1 MAG: AhpC/TSA family protein [Phenylobacterium sp.]